jgi:hypothetical protein
MKIWKMGCKWSTAKNNLKKCLSDLQQVLVLVEKLKEKYRQQQISLQAEIMRDIKQKVDKKNILGKLKRKKIIEHYVDVCQKRIDVIIEKEYALEQLNITSLHIEALKSTVSVFKTFNTKNNYEKLEELQTQYEDLTDDISDINSLLENQPFIDIDEDELEKDLKELENDLLPQPFVATIEETIHLPDVPQTEAVLKTLKPNALKLCT